MKIKNLLTVTVSLLGTSLHAQIKSTDLENGRLDTAYYRNGKIESITEVDSLYRRTGSYKRYDSTGVLIEEGRFGQIDSAECLNCYEGTMGHDFPGSWYSVRKIEVSEIKTGQWVAYHPNRKIASSGSYDTLFTFFQHAVKPIGDSGPFPVGLHMEQLKTGIWRYYNENGEMYLKEEYYKGTLVSRFEYDGYGYKR